MEVTFPNRSHRDGKERWNWGYIFKGEFIGLIKGHSWAWCVLKMITEAA